MAKIVQLSSVHPSFDTRIFHKICRSLVDNGYNVDLIIQHPQSEVVEGVQIKALPLAERKSDRIRKILPEVLRKCREYPKGTVFHFHDPELIPIGFFLKMKGYKVIYDVHEDVPKDILTKDWIPGIFRRSVSKLMSILEIKASEKFDHIITVTPSITEKFNVDKVTEIRNYPIIQGSLSKSADHISERYVIYVGDLTSRRGISQMVDAIDGVKSEVYFYLGGNFSEEGLRDSLENKSGWKKTKYLDWVNQEKLYPLLQNAIAGMLTLNDIPSHRESLPVKLFEYMYAGIPVIASDFPLWREIIQKANCGILVDPINPKQIANALQWLLDHPEEAKEMGENGRKAVLENYSWANEEKKLLNLYENLIAQ